MKYNTINDYFSKIYCINLDRRPERYAQSVEEFKKIDANVQRVSGIDGNTADPPIGIGTGAFGLVLTHVNLIKEAVKYKYNNILIFEDDVIFVNNFNEIFNEKIKFLPEDWDLLYVGGNHILYVNGFDLITGDKNFKVTKENYKTLNYELSRSPCTYCTHAIAISSRIYDRMLNKIKQSPTSPIDNIYYQAQMEGCNAYTFLPSLALQRAGYSDIENQYIDYANMRSCSF